MTGPKKLLRVVASTVVIYYFIVVALGVTAHPYKADIAVVLGNEVMPTGLPSARLAARLDCALALYREKKVPLIMVSGGPGAAGYDEATAMAAYLMKNGVPRADIIVDNLGVNTMATAVNAAKLMKDQNMKSAVIVTQYFHIPRTELAFYMAGVTNFSADYPAFFEWRDIPSTLREMVAIPVYWFTKSHVP